MQVWQQNYDPLNNIWLSSLIALLLPVLFFFKLKMKGHQAATITVMLALGVALLLYHMPWQQALASAAYGFLYGLWPIAWIIVPRSLSIKSRSGPGSSISFARPSCRSRRISAYRC